MMGAVDSIAIDYNINMTNIAKTLLMSPKVINVPTRASLAVGTKLYFPLAEERKKWKMLSHTPLGSGRRDFESRVQCFH